LSWIGLVCYSMQMKDEVLRYIRGYVGVSSLPEENWTFERMIVDGNFVRGRVDQSTITGLINRLELDCDINLGLQPDYPTPISLVEAVVDELDGEEFPYMEVVEEPSTTDTS